ncbi:hypothetical protein STAS_14023 [Striga asiatica]|uniref:Uncharacterized protein n=1 Tax=Striga asiatica TaxID=4170 RepID=A0A5A7PYI8_STRAF|nr:hypothetical protein STAS_14023 [Striga asiatica]
MSRIRNFIRENYANALHPQIRGYLQVVFPDLARLYQANWTDYDRLMNDVRNWIYAYLKPMFEMGMGFVEYMYLVATAMNNFSNIPMPIGAGQLHWFQPVLPTPRFAILDDVRALINLAGNIYPNPSIRFLIEMEGYLKSLHLTSFPFEKDPLSTRGSFSDGKD